MKMKRQVTYILMALAMALMLVLSGCGSLGSSQDFSGTWGYIGAPQKNNLFNNDFSDTFYVITIEKKTEHTYTIDSKDYQYRTEGRTFLNRSEYVPVNPYMSYIVSLPEGPDSKGVLPNIAINYKLMDVTGKSEPLTMTERDNVLYVDKNGLEYTYDSKNDTLVSGSIVLQRLKDGDITPLKEEVQKQIKDDYQKKYVDTNKWNITQYNFNDDVLTQK